MLSEKARELLRCRAFTRAGWRCRSYRFRDLETCVQHSAWRSRRHEAATIVRARATCDCAAFAWPHRRGSGGCNWPDPPTAICATPLGTRRSRPGKAPALNQRPAPPPKPADPFDLLPKPEPRALPAFPIAPRREVMVSERSIQVARRGVRDPGGPRF